MSLYGTQRDSDTTKTCKHQYQSAAQKAKAPAQLLLQLTASTKQVTSLPTCIVQAQQSFQEVQQQQQRHCHSAGTEQSETSPALCKAMSKAPFAPCSAVAAH